MEEHSRSCTDSMRELYFGQRSPFSETIATQRMRCRIRFFERIGALIAFAGKRNSSRGLRASRSNSSLMILRKRRRRGELSIEGPSATGSNCLSMEFIDARPGPEEFYGRQEAHSILVRSIERLPVAFRSVVQERLFRGRSTEGAAEILGISPAATKSRLLRAKNRLGKTMRAGRSMG